MGDFEKVKILIREALFKIDKHTVLCAGDLFFVRESLSKIHQTLFGRSPTGFTAAGKRKGG